MQLIYSLSKGNSFSKDFRLVSQITNSAVSSMANIAEGFHRKSNKDFMKFLDYSRSSIAETVSHAYVALDQNYITQEQFDSARGLAVEISKMLSGLMAYLRKSDMRGRKYSDRC